MGADFANGGSSGGSGAWSALGSLPLLDYGARMFLTRGFPTFTTADPLSEVNRNISPVAFCSDNPVNRIDADGRIDWPLQGARAVNKADHPNGAWGLNNTVVRTSPYREERNIGTSPHIGIDYRASVGTPVYSLGDGTVSGIGTMGNGIKYISITYGNGDELRFLHMNSVSSDMKVGGNVSEGQVIGEAGNSGKYRTKNGSYANYQPHLHVDAKDSKGNSINPEQNNYGTVSSEKFFDEMGGDFEKLQEERANSVNSINEVGKESKQ